MAEVLEVQPVSWRVVSLNAPYLKSLCVFEALSRALGCCYNHHHPQVVCCEAWVRLPAPRITRVRGHTSHTLAVGQTPTINTTIEMGTYLVFHLVDWTKVQQCHLVLHGIEKVPKTHTMTHAILQRVDSLTTTIPHTTTNDTQHINVEGENQPHPQAQQTHSLTLPKTPNHHHRELQRQLTQPHLATLDLPDDSQEQTGAKEMVVNMTEAEEVVTLLDDDDDDGCESDASDELHKVVAQRVSVDVTRLLTPPPSNQMLVLLLRPHTLNAVHNNISTHIPASPHTPISPHTHCSADTHGSLGTHTASHKFPTTHAWQFQSACIKVSHFSSQSMVKESCGTLKKTLTRTKPLYFSKNGNVHRL